jgi:flagellar motor protein MotB
VRRRHDDSTAWIGYSDFLTTLAVLFLVLAASLAAGTRAGPAHLLGVVRDARSGRGLDGCSVRMGTGREQPTAGRGAFAFEVTELAGSVSFRVDVRCSGYGAQENVVSLAPGDTTRLSVVLNPTQETASPESSFVVRAVPGDALFDPNEWTLRPGAVERIQSIGRELRDHLRPDEVVAVQGHTDDSPFPAGAGKDNWVLSGERASSAAKVLTDQQYEIGIPECRVIIMGFGPSRPVHPLLPADDAETRRRKRADNRRIEFRTLRGAGLAGGTCG